MNNTQIAEILLGMALAVEFLEDNPFKVKAYREGGTVHLRARSVPWKNSLRAGEIDRMKGVRPDHRRPSEGLGEGP
ncbi:MAG: helix-hairpin-helix domain-containing protein [Desulfobacterales bacterium]|nr:helix-hairpin-helix domain-containing protein [Desulfobacterales bacterium]